MPWINAKDKLPNEDKLVLACYDGVFYLATLYKAKGKVYIKSDDLFGVACSDVYWRYLPKKPTVISDGTDDRRGH